MELKDDLELDSLFDRIKSVFGDEKINDIDGLKIDFNEGWVHMRKSNTEPIVRIYAEARDEKVAKSLIDKVRAVK